ncbi:hypothetical protein JCGZ_14928 [Jatropha curcas]|uniref:Uncharacterized protein n=1 Tax=Jatropha curcas TaxID=180498 RepID=A0A067KHK9_JATCU|nr:hypothetical protein JCGZ_14928 [Jatropha curcas]
MRVSKWTRNFRPNTDCSIVPVWILFEGLPIHLFDKAALFPIANLIGKPLKVDATTSTLSRRSVARVCVELDLSKDLHNRVWIDNGDLGFFQPVSYESLPLFCPKCCRFGHKIQSCPLNSSSSVPTSPADVKELAKVTQQWIPKTTAPTTIVSSYRSEVSSAELPTQTLVAAQTTAPTTIVSSHRSEVSSAELPT